MFKSLFIKLLFLIDQINLVKKNKRPLIYYYLAKCYIANFILMLFKNQVLPLMALESPD